MSRWVETRQGLPKHPGYLMAIKGKIGPVIEVIMNDYFDYLKSISNSNRHIFPTLIHFPPTSLQRFSEIQVYFYMEVYRTDGRTCIIC